MFDITERKSFDDLKLWLSEIKSEIRTKMPKIIVANKSDLVESGQRERAVTEKEVVDFCVENNLIFKETSVITGDNVKESFNEFVQSIYTAKQVYTSGVVATRRSIATTSFTALAFRWRKTNPKRSRAIAPIAQNAADFYLQFGSILEG